MKDKFELTKEHITSKQYFQDGALWYNGKFVFPIVQRSVLLIATTLLIMCVSVISYQIREQLPILTNIKYLIGVGGDIFSNDVSISLDERSDSNALSFITEILCKDYVIKRENYDYDKLRDQIVYIKQTSTKTLFKSFYDSLSTSSPTSPLTRYQKYGKRSISIKKFNFLDRNNVIVDFKAEARDMDNKIFETAEYSAKLSFEADALRVDMKSGSPYKFLVTGYRVQNK